MKYSVRTLIPLLALVAHVGLYLESEAYPWIWASLVPRPVVHFLAGRYTGQLEEVPWVTARFASAFVSVLLLACIAFGAWSDHRQPRNAPPRV
jgi:hypothetical protein